MPIEKPDIRYRPSHEYRYWLYDPEGRGMLYFRTQAERDKHAVKVFDLYLEEGEWMEEVEGVAAGEVTHFAQMLDKKERPKNDALDEDGYDSEHFHWPDGIENMGNYTLCQLKT